MDINDQVIKAIQTYADAMPVPEDESRKRAVEEFRLNLLATAEDMAPKIIEIMGLKQEWAVLSLEKVQRIGPDGHLLPLYEELSDVRCDSANREQVVSELQMQQEVYGDATLDWYRQCIGTRLYQEWTEEVQPTVDPEMEALLDIPGT